MSEKSYLVLEQMDRMLKEELILPDQAGCPMYSKEWASQSGQTGFPGQLNGLVNPVPFEIRNLLSSVLVDYSVLHPEVAAAKKAWEEAYHKADEYLAPLLPKGQMMYDFEAKNGLRVQVIVSGDEENRIVFGENHVGLPQGWDLYICNGGIAFGRFPKNMDINKALSHRNRVKLLFWHEAKITNLVDGSTVVIEVPPISKPVPDADGKIDKAESIFYDIIIDYMAGNQFFAMPIYDELNNAADFLSNIFNRMLSIIEMEDSDSLPEGPEEAKEELGLNETSFGVDKAKLGLEKTSIGDDKEGLDVGGATTECDGDVPSDQTLSTKELEKAGIQVTEETITDERSLFQKKKEALLELLMICCTSEEMYEHFVAAAKKWGIPVENLPDVHSYLDKANRPPEVTGGCLLDAKDIANRVMGILMEVIALADSRLEDFYNDPDKPLGPTDRKHFKDMLIYLMAGVNSGSMETSAVSYKVRKGKAGISLETVRRIRHELKPDLFEFIFKEFTRRLRTSPDLKPLFRTMFGFLLYCVDGSDLNLPRNKFDEQTSCSNGKGKKTFNQIHLNAIYDCLNGFYAACNFRGTKKTGQGERGALFELLKELSEEEKAQCLLLMDRGYDGHETVGRLQKEGIRFLMRVKANDSNGLLSSFAGIESLGDEFYVEVHYTISRKNMKGQEDDKMFRVVKKKFDFLEEDESLLVHLRILQFRLPSGELETLITNVPIWELSPMQMYHLYSRRWGIMPISA